MLTVDYDELGLTPGDLVLDLGAGAGRHSYESFRRGARGSVIFTVSTVDSPGRPFVNTSVAPVTAVAPSVTLTR